MAAISTTKTMSDDHPRDGARVHRAKVRRHLRALFFVAAGAFFVLGPVHTQVFLGKHRTAKHPFRPMAWQMYHTVGVGLCQATFWEERDGERVDYPRATLQEVIASNVGPRRARASAVVTTARERDVRLGARAHYPKIARGLCAMDAEGAADVRAHVRCSPPLPGGKWEVVEAGGRNLCSNKHAATPRSGRTREAP